MKVRHILDSAAATTLFSSQAALAHPGHGATAVHLHNWGSEGLVVLGVVLVLLAIACWRR